MARARDGPMPGSLVSSSSVAMLRITRPSAVTPVVISAADPASATEGDAALSDRDVGSTGGAPDAEASTSSLDAGAFAPADAPMNARTAAASTAPETLAASGSQTEKRGAAARPPMDACVMR